MRTVNRFGQAAMIMAIILGLLSSQNTVAAASREGGFQAPGSLRTCPTEAVDQAQNGSAYRADHDGKPSPIPIRDVPAEQSAVMPETLISDLVMWIGERTDYDVSKALARPPRVFFVEEGTRIAYEGRELDIGPTLRATYDGYAREIHLKCPWSASDVHDISTLLHELIHDVQYYNRLWPCPREAEWEAYALQADWLEEQGETSQNNWLQGVLLSGCRGDVHP